MTDRKRFTKAIGEILLTARDIVGSAGHVSVSLFGDEDVYAAYLTWDTKLVGERWSGGHTFLRTTLEKYRGDISVEVRRIVEQWKKDVDSQG